MSSDRPEFPGRGSYIAEGMHAEAPVSDLERILDEFDHRHARPTAQGNRVIRSPEEQFRLDWVAQREGVVRAALEEVAWKLDQRGHRAWVDLVDGERSEGQDGDSAGIALYLLPATAADGSEPARFALHPRYDRFQIEVEPSWAAIDTLDPHRGHERTNAELDELAVVTMATRVAERALLGGAEPPPAT